MKNFLWHDVIIFRYIIFGIEPPRPPSIAGATGQCSRQPAALTIPKNYLRTGRQRRRPGAVRRYGIAAYPLRCDDTATSRPSTHTPPVAGRGERTPRQSVLIIIIIVIITRVRERTRRANPLAAPELDRGERQKHTFLGPRSAFPTGRRLSHFVLYYEFLFALFAQMPVPTFHCPQ